MKKSDLKYMIDGLIQHVNELEARIVQLEMNNGNRVVSIPTVFPVPATPYEPNVQPKEPQGPAKWPAPAPAKKTCPKCGIELPDFMSYSCPLHPCPCGLNSLQVPIDPTKVID